MPRAQTTRRTTHPRRPDPNPDRQRSWAPPPEPRAVRLLDGHGDAQSVPAPRERTRKGMAPTPTSPRKRGQKGKARPASPGPRARKRKGRAERRWKEKATAVLTTIGGEGLYFAREGRWIFTWIVNEGGVVVGEAKWPEVLEVPDWVTAELFRDPPAWIHSTEVEVTFSSLNLGVVRAATAAVFEALAQLYKLWTREASLGSAAKEVAYAAGVAWADGTLKAALSYSFNELAKLAFGKSTFTIAGQVVGGAPAAAAIFVAETCYQAAQVVTGKKTKAEAAKTVVKNAARLGLVWTCAELGAMLGTAGGPVGTGVGLVGGGLVGLGAWALGERLLG